jgi:hypothetical protein
MAISEAIRAASAAEGGDRLMRPLSCANAVALNIRAAGTTKGFHIAFRHNTGGRLLQKSRQRGAFL